MANIINGKEISASVKERIRLETEKLFEETGVKPGLAVIIVGDDPASRIYVNNKKKACADIGFNSWEYALPAQTTEAELLELINKLNAEGVVPAAHKQSALDHTRKNGNVDITSRDHAGDLFVLYGKLVEHDSCHRYSSRALGNHLVLFDQRKNSRTDLALGHGNDLVNVF